MASLPLVFGCLGAGKKETGRLVHGGWGGLMNISPTSLQGWVGGCLYGSIARGKEEGGSSVLTGGVPFQTSCPWESWPFGGLTDSSRRAQPPTSCWLFLQACQVQSLSVFRRVFYTRCFLMHTVLECTGGTGLDPPGKVAVNV